MLRYLVRYKGDERAIYSLRLPRNDDFLKDVKLYVGVPAAKIAVMISVGMCGPTAVLSACRKRRVFARQL